MRNTNLTLLHILQYYLLNNQQATQAMLSTVLLLLLMAYFLGTPCILPDLIRLISVICWSLATSTAIHWSTTVLLSVSTLTNISFQVLLPYMCHCLLM